MSPEPNHDREKNVDVRYAQNPTVAHESSDVDIRHIIQFASLLFLCLMLANFLLWVLYGAFEFRATKTEPKPSPLAAQRQSLPPEPRLQGAPGHEQTPLSELEKLREQENQMLNRFGWVDRKAGIVRLPIEKAKDILLKRGLPTRPQTRAGADRTAEE
jgi:hypothetical protein